MVLKVLYRHKTYVYSKYYNLFTIPIFFISWLIDAY